MSAANCGTPAGYSAHRRRKEPACQPCTKAVAVYQQQRSQARREAIARGEIIPGPGSPHGPRPKAREVFISEVEFLVSCGEGWQRVLQAVGTPTPEALTQRLYKAGRYDLVQTLELPRRYDERQAA